MEIERKWLLNKMPETFGATIATIYQSYLVVSEDIEVRVRKYETNDATAENKIPYKLTIKGSGSIAREEIEFPITAEQYKAIIRLINKNPIIKQYKKWDVYGKTIECSKVDGEWFYAEVEFDSIEEAEKYEFPYPQSVIREVTREPSYKMKNYWKRTRG